MGAVGGAGGRQGVPLSWAALRRLATVREDKDILLTRLPRESTLPLLRKAASTAAAPFVIPPPVTTTARGATAARIFHRARRLAGVHRGPMWLRPRVIRDIAYLALLTSLAHSIRGVWVERAAAIARANLAVNASATRPAALPMSRMSLASVLV